MKKNIFLLSLFIFSTFFTNLWANQSDDLHHDLNVLTQSFLQHAQQGHVPVSAVEVSVLLPNESTPRDFSAGTITTNGSNATPNNLIQYGSITKEYTASLILKLVASNKITLQTPLIKIFPEKFTKKAKQTKKNWPEQWQSVTPEMLLNMTSGITTYSMPKIIKTINPYYTHYSLDGIVSLAANYQLKNGCHKEDLCFLPGTSWGYSNTNYIIAGMIIEKYFKKSYSHMLNQLIIKPLYLNYHVNIYYAMQYDNKLYRQMLHGYLPEETANELDNLSLFHPNQDVTVVPLDYVGPAGGLTGTTHALTLLTRAFFDTNLFPGYDQIQTTGLVLPAKNGQKVAAKNIDSECLSELKGCYGLGVGVMYDKKYGQIWMYTGNYLGYATTYAYFKNTKTIIALSQNAGATGTYHQTANHMIEAVYDEVLDYLNHQVK